MSQSYTPSQPFYIPSSFLLKWLAPRKLQLVYATHLLSLIWNSYLYCVSVMLKRALKGLCVDSFRASNYTWSIRVAKNTVHELRFNVLSKMQVPANECHIWHIANAMPYKHLQPFANNEHGFLCRKWCDIRADDYLLPCFPKLHQRYVFN